MQATDTVLIAVMSIVVKSSSNLIPPGDDVSKYSAEEIQTRIYGSKLVVVTEQMQLITIWLIKACLLIMYARMTTILPQHKIVIATAYYAGITFVRTRYSEVNAKLTAVEGCDGDSVFGCLVPPLQSILGSPNKLK